MVVIVWNWSEWGDCVAECDELTNLPFVFVKAYTDGIRSLFLVGSILNLSDLNITSSDVTLKHGSSSRWLASFTHRFLFG